MFKMPWTRISELAAQVNEWMAAHETEVKIHAQTIKDRDDLKSQLESLTLTAQALKAQLDQARQERDSALDANNVLSALAKYRLERIESARAILSDCVNDPYIKSSKALKAALAQLHDLIQKAKDALWQAQEQN